VSWCELGRRLRVHGGTAKRGAIGAPNARYSMALG
jgi:hypothetical protein